MANSRLTMRRPPTAPRRTQRPAITPRQLRDGAAPTEILDVVTGPFERRIVAAAKPRSPRR